MIRDEVQIRAERDYAIREAVEEAVKKALDCGREEGREEGMEEERAKALNEKLEAARLLIQKNVPVQDVIESLKLSEEQARILTNQ